MLSAARSPQQGFFVRCLELSHIFRKDLGHFGRSLKPTALIKRKLFGCKGFAMILVKQCVSCMSVETHDALVGFGVFPGQDRRRSTFIDLCGMSDPAAIASRALGCIAFHVVTATNYEQYTTTSTIALAWTRAEYLVEPRTYCNNKHIFEVDPFDHLLASTHLEHVVRTLVRPKDERKAGCQPLILRA